MKIGVFDSGVGGISVLRNIHHLNASFVYFGDSMNAPYGNKSTDEILLLTGKMLSFLKSCGCDMYISACNSISAQNTKNLLSRLHITSDSYIDMVSATKKHIQNILVATDNVLIYATEATIRSNAYQEVFADVCKFSVLASRDLARSIEKDDIIGIQKEFVLLRTAISGQSITHIFLGCTHFPLIEADIRHAIPKGVTIIDPAFFVQKEVEMRIADTESKPFVRIHTSDSTSTIAQIAQNYIQNYTITETKLM